MSATAPPTEADREKVKINLYLDILLIYKYLSAAMS